MPTRVAVDDDEQQIQDLIKEMRRLRSRLATTAVTGTHNEFTAAATPATTYTLTYIPLTGTCLMALNGHVQREGTDYTCDYSTGVVTVSATQASGDKITFRYLVTDWLIARSLAEDTGSVTFVAANTATSASSVSSINVTIPASAAVGDLLVLAGVMRFVSATFDTPTGWTLARQNASSGIEDVASWYRVCQSGDPGSTVTLNINSGFSDFPSAACLAYRNVDQTTPLFIANTNYSIGTTTSWQGGALDCSLSSRPCVGVMIWGSFRDGSPLTLPSGVTSRVSINSSSTRFLVIADETIAPSTMQPTRTVTATTAQTYGVCNLAFSGA